jgi:haloacid dehalogenase-like hydrolase
MPRRAHDRVILFDVDDTLIDNDGFKEELRRHLVQAYGRKASDRYWEIYEVVRKELGYADFLETLQRYRTEQLHDPRLVCMSGWLLDYPFVDRLYPQALNVVSHMRRWGLPVILSDGDAVFQPRKIEKSGLWNAFDGHVLIYIHKQAELDNVRHFYPAKHYVIVDDKLPILDAVKEKWGDRVTTVFAKQGHYANDPAKNAGYASADLTIGHIGELMNLDFSEALAS